MTTKAQVLTIITLGATLVTAPAQTNQTTQAAAGARRRQPSAPTEQTIYDIKNPVSWLSWGADLRIRNEYFNNALSLGSEYRGAARLTLCMPRTISASVAALWTSITPVEDLSLNARLAAEPREFMEPSTIDTFFEQDGHAVAVWDYSTALMCNGGNPWTCRQP